MATQYLNKYVGTFDPGNVRQSVVAKDLASAAAMLSASIEGVEPYLIQCTERNIAVVEPEVVPTYTGGAPRLLDINPVYIGMALEPMIITPDEPEDLTGRVYEAYVVDGTGARVADLLVTVVDISLGILSLSMSAVESAKLTAGTYTWLMTWEVGGVDPQISWMGKLYAVAI